MEQQHKNKGYDSVTRHGVFTKQEKWMNNSFKYSESGSTVYHRITLLKRVTIESAHLPAKHERDMNQLQQM